MRAAEHDLTISVCVCVRAAQEGDAVREEAAAGGVAAGRGGAGRRAQLEEVRAEGHPGRQVPQVSTQQHALVQLPPDQPTDGATLTTCWEIDRRAYFRCTHRHSQGCLATKHVQRADGDPLLHDVVYHGAHTCVQAAHPGANQLRQELQLQHGHSAKRKDQGASSPLALATGLLEPMTPYSFASGADFPLFSPTGLDGQLRSSHGAGIGVEFETLFEELFTNATEPFQWDLYAAN